MAEMTGSQDARELIRTKEKEEAALTPLPDLKEEEVQVPISSRKEEEAEVQKARQAAEEAAAAVERARALRTPFPEEGPKSNFIFPKPNLVRFS